MRKIGGMKKESTELLCECVGRSLNRYFADMNGEEPTELYDLVIGQIEKPLLEVVMDRSESNQTRAAKMLGINRNTLRKKLRHYGLD